MCQIKSLKLKEKVKFNSFARGNLDQGILNVAKYLNIDPSKALFLNTTVVNDNNLGRKLYHKPSLAHSEILSILPKITTATPKGVCLYVNQQLLDYLDEAGLAPKANYININKHPSKEIFPFYSLSGYFKDFIYSNNCKERYKNYTLVSSFLGNSDKDIASVLSGNLIMEPEEQVKFNSKYYMRKLREKYIFNIPVGVGFLGLNSLNSAFKDMEKKLISKNINPKHALLWSKFESQTSGNGSFRFKGLTEENLLNLKNHILDFSNELGLSKNSILCDIPLVLEVDINSIPNESQIENIGVEAVVAEDRITFVGCVSQKSENGKYIGSIIDNKCKKYSAYAEISSMGYLKAIQEEGYRGFITIDVLLTYNSKKKKIKGYNIDPNARFTSGTPLLSLLHYSQSMCQRELVGFSYSNCIKDSNNIFEKIKSYCGSDLYLGEKSDYQGIIPIILNDVDYYEKTKRYLRTVVISKSMATAQSMYLKFKENIIKDLQH